jgi:hypothetical protein
MLLLAALLLIYRRDIAWCKVVSYSLGSGFENSYPALRLLFFGAAKDIRAGKACGDEITLLGTSNTSIRRHPAKYRREICTWGENSHV